VKVECLIVGQLQTNCYLVWDGDEGIVIDPGDAGDFIIEKIQRLGFKPKLVLATHGHFDHILGALEVKLAFNIPFLLHKKDVFLLKRMRASAKYFTGLTVDPPPEVDRFIDEGDKISFGGESLKALATPGHTPGGISLYSNKLLFSGDTLFKQGVGRTDFRYASGKDLRKSLKRLLRLPPKTIVYPGHGGQTTIGEEKQASLNIVKF
jgi:hydroxyacylglutathione hydrolase